MAGLATRERDLCAANGPLRFGSMRDLEVIDSELRLLAAVCRVCREQDGVLPSIGPVDELLDECSSTDHHGPV